MTQERYILGDWGTSSARFYLYRGESLVELVKRPGVKFTNDSAESFRTAVEPWTQAHGPLTAVLSGMVGSNIGWREAGYVPCPARFISLADQILRFVEPSGSIHIVPGVKTATSLVGPPDVMRGEETQIFGWASVNAGDGLLCLPGTHTKWVKLKDGVIENFMTSLNGELFNVLTQHSILIGKDTLSDPVIGEEFLHGVDLGASDTALNQLLFSARSLQLAGRYNPAQANSYLLGLLIGSDVRGGLKIEEGAKVDVIGGLAPAQFYAAAIHQLGGKAIIHDGQESALLGLRRIYNELKV